MDLANTVDREELRPPVAQVFAAPNGVSVVPVPGWEALPWLWHGFSTRIGGLSGAYVAEENSGELNLGFTPDDDRQNVLRNRRLLAAAVTGSPDTPIATLRQIHSAVLVVYGPDNLLPAPCDGDGIMTSRSGILLGVQTADCVPVLVADRRRKVVAAFHAGWRGTVKHIVENGVGRMRLEYGSEPHDLVAAIGPAIGPCCYSVGDEVFSEFESQFAYGAELFHRVRPVNPTGDQPALPQGQPTQAGPSLHLDLLEANCRQLLSAGLAPQSISMVGGCTACQPRTFFSHRAANGRAGRMLSVIGIRTE